MSVFGVELEMPGVPDGSYPDMGTVPVVVVARGKIRTYVGGRVVPALSGADAVARHVAGGGRILVPSRTVADRIMRESRDVSGRAVRVLAALPSSSRVMVADQGAAVKWPQAGRLNIGQWCAQAGLVPVQSADEGLVQVDLLTQFAPLFLDGVLAGARAVKVEEIQGLEEQIAVARDPYRMFGAAEQAAALWQALAVSDPGGREVAALDGTVVEAEVVKGSADRVVAVSARPVRSRPGRILVTVGRRGWPSSGQTQWHLERLRARPDGAFELGLRAASKRPKRMPAGTLVTLMEAPFVAGTRVKRSKWNRGPGVAVRRPLPPELQ